MEERQEIERLLRSGKTQQRVAKRAALILLADDGLNNQEIADQLETSRYLVQKWRKRFALYEGSPSPPGQEPDALARLEALEDMSRSGRPPVFSPSGAAHGGGRGLSKR
jgi:DNA-binding CsgD family transcriptional regulator